MDSQKVWAKILEIIKLEVSSANFRTWFQGADIESIDETKIILSVPSAFLAQQLKIRYLPLLEKATKQVLEKDLIIEFKIDPSKALKKKALAIEEEDLFTIPEAISTPVLNPKFTLDNFVVGLSNNVAFAAAQAVAQNPGTSYNPLFFYGGTGVGKTHLMLGIGNAILAKNPSAKVIYCSSEKFMNDYVEAIKSNRMGDLRNKYRNSDILLIDDIQFFSGREGTQEEFFHTFNELQSKNSQMVLTSDRPPNEIAKLEDRLKSRFVGGLMVDIQPPDFDTRAAILKAKSEEKGVIIPEDALKLLASSLETNIREVEGKLIQIIQALKAQNLPFTIESVAQYLGQPQSKPTKLDQKKVLSLICNYFNLNMKDLTGPKRQKEFVLPRHIAMYFLCEEISLTVEHVGKILGGRDHTTVMHGRDRIKKLVHTDREVQKMLIDLKQQALQ
jgi:chromosomal replication initiator protein